MKVWGVIASLAMSVVSSGSLAATDYINNGGFDNGSLQGWTASGNSSWAYASTNDRGLSPQAGGYFLSMGPANWGYLSQTFSDVKGRMLTVTGWMASNGQTPNGFSMAFDGRSLVRVTNIATQGYVKYSFQQRATGKDTFTLGGFDNPSQMGLDSFSVSGGAVPEPTAWTMMIIGVGLIGAMQRRRRSLARAALA